MKELGYDVEFSIWVGLVRAQGHAGRRSIDRSCAPTRRRRSPTEQFSKAIDELGDVVAYLDQPSSATFWDADAKRVEAAVQSIGKVQG